MKGRTEKKIRKRNMSRCPLCGARLVGNILGQIGEKLPTLIEKEIKYEYLDNESQIICSNEHCKAEISISIQLDIKRPQPFYRLLKGEKITANIHHGTEEDFTVPNEGFVLIGGEKQKGRFHATLFGTKKVKREDRTSGGELDFYGFCYDQSKFSERIPDGYGYYSFWQNRLVEVAP